MALIALQPVAGHGRGGASVLRFPSRRPVRLGATKMKFMKRVGIDAKDQNDGAGSLPAMYQPEPVWDCYEASRFLCIHPATAKRLAREGELPAFRIGNRWRFRPSELDAWARSAVLSSHSLRRE